MNKNNKKMIITGLAVGAVNGFFGGGGGLILVPLLKKYLKTDIKKAHATSISITFILSIVTVCVYAITSGIETDNIAIYMIGGAVGGAIGAIVLKKIPKRALHFIFAAFLIFSAVRMWFR